MRILRLVCGLLLTVAASAVQVVQKPECSIAIPDGWREMPRDVIENYEHKLAEVAPTAKRQHYNYGFQSPDKGWFEYPYLLVQRNDVGKISQAELERLGPAQMKTEVDKQRKSWGPVLSDLTVGTPVYDREHKMLWMTMQANVDGEGIVTGIAGMVPTEKGTIQACGYAPKTDFPKYEDAFRAAIVSLTPAPDLQYKTTFGTNLSGNGLLSSFTSSWAFIGALVGIVVANFIVARRKRNTPSN